MYSPFIKFLKGIYRFILLLLAFFIVSATLVIIGLMLIHPKTNFGVDLLIITAMLFSAFTILFFKSRRKINKQNFVWHFLGATLVSSLLFGLFESPMEGNFEYGDSIEIPSLSPSNSNDVFENYQKFPFEKFPKPSTYMWLRANVAVPSAISYSDVAKQVEEAAYNAGYPQLNYFALASSNDLGLVMLTDLERIDNQGRRASIKPFDLAALPHLRHLNIVDFLEYLFTAQPGRYRFIITVLSEEFPLVGTSPGSREIAERLIAGAAQYVHPAFNDIYISDSTKISFLVYEFIKHVDAVPEQLGPGRIPARDHLVYSRLAELLYLPPSLGSTINE